MHNEWLVKERKSSIKLNEISRYHYIQTVIKMIYFKCLLNFLKLYPQLFFHSFLGITTTAGCRMEFCIEKPLCLFKCVVCSTDNGGKRVNNFRCQQNSQAFPLCTNKLDCGHFTKNTREIVPWRIYILRLCFMYKVFTIHKKEKC